MNEKLIRVKGFIPLNVADSDAVIGLLGRFNRPDSGFTIHYLPRMISQPVVGGQRVFREFSIEGTESILVHQINQIYIVLHDFGCLFWYFQYWIVADKFAKWIDICPRAGHLTSIFPHLANIPYQDNWN